MECPTCTKPVDGDIAAVFIKLKFERGTGGMTGTDGRNDVEEPLSAMFDAALRTMRTNEPDQRLIDIAAAAALTLLIVHRDSGPDRELLERHCAANR